MERNLEPVELRPKQAVDAYYAIVAVSYTPRVRAQLLSRYVNDWGQDEDRRVLLDFEQALGWAEDPVDGDVRDATLDREVIAALATEVMVRYWRVEMLCDIRNVGQQVTMNAAQRYQLTRTS
jgi:hypothetical protein